jgi:hypothetical protein
MITLLGFKEVMVNESSENWKRAESKSLRELKIIYFSTLENDTGLYTSLFPGNEWESRGTDRFTGIGVDFH